MRKSKVVNLMMEISSLNEGQATDVLGYVEHLKTVREVSRPEFRTIAMAEIKTAIKRGYSF